MVDEQGHARISIDNGHCSVNDEDEMTKVDQITESERKKRRIEKENESESKEDEIGFSKPPFGEALITPFSVSSMVGKMHFDKDEIQHHQQQHNIHRSSSPPSSSSRTNAEAYNFIPSPPSSWHERRQRMEKGPNDKKLLLSTDHQRRDKRDFMIVEKNNNQFKATFFPYSLPIPPSRRLPTPPPLPPIYSDLRKQQSMPPTKKPSQQIVQRGGGGRGRIAVACDPCRAFKRKCSGEQPCELCKRRGRSHECKYEPGPCSLPRTQQTNEAGPSTPKITKPINQHSHHHHRNPSSSSTKAETQQEESETSESDFEFEDAQMKGENKSDQFSNSMVQWNSTFQAQFQPQPFAPPPLPPIENNYDSRYRSRSFSHPYAYSRNVLPLPRLTVVEPVQTRHRRSYSLHTPAPESRRE